MAQDLEKLRRWKISIILEFLEFGRFIMQTRVDLNMILSFRLLDGL
jgi:hypothetical protein